MWIKVCGLTSVENATAVAELGINAIGLNFYEKSIRCVDVARARKIVNALPPGVEPIGLFVNHSLAEIHKITEQTGIRTIQLHGDESPEFASQLHNLKIIRSLRIAANNIGTLPQVIADYHHAGVPLIGCLLDAKVDNTFGGTGQTAPWELIAKQYQPETWPPLILAGGLTPANVGAAVSRVQPWGVDTASGVESSPGIKDIDLVREFIERTKFPSA